MSFVPYVEALAFWGRAVEHRTVPKAYAQRVLLEHPLITEHTPGTPESRAAVVAQDLDRWEDRVVEMLRGADDLPAHLRRRARPQPN